VALRRSVWVVPEAMSVALSEEAVAKRMTIMLGIVRLGPPCQGQVK
jgi:hypothetical protein